MVLSASLGLTSELGHQRYIKLKRLMSLACVDLRVSDLSNEGVTKVDFLVYVMLSLEEALRYKEIPFLRVSNWSSTCISD